MNERTKTDLFHMWISGLISESQLISCYTKKAPKTCVNYAWNFINWKLGE